MKKTILNIGEVLNKAEQKEVNGGMVPTALCSGTGTGGGATVGHSAACIGQSVGTKCIINGYLAACTTSTASDNFWFY